MGLAGAEVSLSISASLLLPTPRLPSAQEKVQEFTLASALPLCGPLGIPRGKGTRALRTVGSLEGLCRGAAARPPGSEGARGGYSMHLAGWRVGAGELFRVAKGVS